MDDRYRNAARNGAYPSADSFRAMSKEEMRHRELWQAQGAKNAWMLQAVNAMPVAQFPPKPQTRWVRFKRWLSSFTD